MMTTSEKATQKSMTLPLRSVHHTSFLPCGLGCALHLGVGDSFVSAPEHQHRDQLFEDHPVWMRGFVATERMVRLSLGQGGVLLSEDFNPGAVLDGVSFANPLEPAFDLAALG
jgi:hypothetical protein